ncbi:slr1658 superfamily regulator [Leptothoe spongobia]|uniref:ATP-binding protein n=1 Tax=Leptothoe spongobia TAU-MAC 1115 TaxID=1967444 RepID=A0A947GK25_9CYAN|nr:hypothetical protein [Leptothoe spongobia]MBT9315942.1 hypothetical protein [Leptothoe spongobia TAU-MAC 1115]
MASPTSSTSESFGQFASDLQKENLCVKIDFPVELVKQRKFWPNSNLSAKFVSEYISIFFPADNNRSDQLRQRTEITDAARYITNELLENAFKFSCTRAKQPVQMCLYHYSNRLVITVTNTAHTNNIKSFRSLIHDLTTLDLTELYVERLEKNLDHKNAYSSGLGFITILINYNTKLGWKIEQSSPESDCFLVTTMVQLLYD